MSNAVILAKKVSMVSNKLNVFNTFGADWRIYASYVQMHKVRNDAYMRYAIKYARYGLTYINAKPITFRVLVCLQRNVPQMFFISRHANPENFIQIDQKRFQLWSLVANHLVRPRLQDFFKQVRCEQLFGNTQWHFLYSFVCNGNLQQCSPYLPA